MNSDIIRLVIPKVWQPITQNALRGLTDPEYDLALSIVSCLHSRHVGITPELAADAARTLLSAASRRRPDGIPSAGLSSDNPWGIALRILRQIALQPPSGAHRASQSETDDDELKLGLLPHAALNYLVMRLMRPLVMQACVFQGESYLFCEDPQGCDIDQQEKYTAYSAALQAKLMQLVSDAAMASGEDHEVDLFWRDRAYTLLSLTRYRTRASNAAIPQLMLSESRIFFDLKPDASSPSNYARSLDLARRQRLRNPSRTEVGADGAHLTHRLEDYHHRLVSEITYPDLVQLDHLLNTGFWAIKPPPKPVQTRDVLVVTIIPREIATTPICTFLKTCWFDFALYTTRLLQHNGLKNSELRWIESSTPGRLRSHVLLVRDLPEILARIGDEQSQLARYHFLKASGLFPAYLDSGASSQALTERTVEEDRSHGQAQSTADDALEFWLKSAWNAQQEFAGWSQAYTDGASSAASAQTTQFDGQKLRFERYMFIYVMAFLPASLVQTQSGKWATEAISRRYRQMAAVFRSAHGFSVTWIPDSIDQGTPWRFDGRRHSTSELAREPFSAQELAGRLVTNWLEDFVDEVQHA